MDKNYWDAVAILPTEVEKWSSFLLAKTVSTLEGLSTKIVGVSFLVHMWVVDE